VKLLLSWLRDWVDVPVEPKKLADDLSRAGFGVDSLESHGNDAILDVDITTNRVDCMNVHGLAREVAVLYGTRLRPLETEFPESAMEAGEALAVEIAAADLCPRFSARVLDVTIGPSPSWIRDRLEAIGLRPINNVVDLTNYVMMEMGHPSHAFDLALIPQGRLHVRWAREGERLTTLDGTERALGARHGVVAGEEGPLALAGIMGGASSEVSGTTRTVALEAAYWDPLSIRRGAKSLGMHTEASHRFERGADPEAPPLATARIAHLLAKTGAGKARRGLIDRYVRPIARRNAILRMEKTTGLLGAPIDTAQAAAILGGLGFDVAPSGQASLQVQIPSWRSDVSREVDLIEEVGRHYGVDRIASTLPRAGEASGLRPGQVRERAIRDLLVGAGLSEVVHYAFVSGSDSTSIHLQNPLSEEQAALRHSLVFPGLLEILAANLRQGRRDVRIFELGRVFLDAPGGLAEERRAAFVLTGRASEPHWSGDERSVDFFDAKGLVDAIGKRLELAGLTLDDANAAAEPRLRLHPGKAARILFQDRPVGFLGSLHPDVIASLGLKGETVVAELSLDALGASGTVRFRPLPRAPAVSRDLSIVCGETVPAAAIEARLRGVAGPLLREVAVADRYQGPQVPEGHVSLTLTLVYQDPGRTLTSEEVEASLERVVRELRSLGWEIRGV
jgi:phenylalanyl-tRNA synthetase beta chain